MHRSFLRPARLLGITAAVVILAVGLCYAVTLGLGFRSLSAPDQAIGNPYFTILEGLILVMAPAMVALTAAIHAWARPAHRPFALAAALFMTMLAVETCGVHFVILTLSRQPGFVGMPDVDRLFAFRWPSVAYALDILGWDIFFPLSMLSAAPVFSGAGIERAIRVGMIVSALVAFSGLAGVAMNTMTVRDIGIVGYLGGFLVVDGLLLILFVRWRHRSQAPGR